MPKNDNKLYENIISFFRGNEKFCSSVDRSIFPISMANIGYSSPLMLDHG